MIGSDALLLSTSAAPDGARRLLRKLDSRLAARGLRGTDVLALTFFADGGFCRAHAKGVGVLVERHFGSPPPPTTVVAQAPLGSDAIALEAVLATKPGSSVERRSCDGFAYSLLRRGDLRQIHGGLAFDRFGDDTEAQATAAFEAMRAVLAHEGMDFGHVVRQWGYIEGLLDVRRDCPRGHQRYQVFNDVRSLFYAGSEFPNGYPAATGIGQSAGGVALEFVALDAPADVRIVPLSNPRQTDAHRYSNGMLVGESLERLPDKTTPKFERAKRITGRNSDLVLVSGTASIVGERSVGVGDVAVQTETTIENIRALVGGAGLSRLRAYVRRRDDFATVRRICEAAFGPIPALYVRADVCRDDLLVELEGELATGARTPVASAGR